MNRRQYVLTLTGILLLAGLWVMGQQPAPIGEVVTQVEQVGSQTTFWELVKQGGVIMVPMGLLSIAAIALIIYGMVATKPEKMLATELLPSLQEELLNLHLEPAKSLCAGSPSLLTNTLFAGLERLSGGILDVPSMEKAMEEASVHEVTAGMKPISYLSIIAQVAPMLGLLGTVSGMIKAFQKIGMGGMGKPELLAADIGEAMVTTAAGLIVGIPCMFFYFLLKTRFMANVSEMSRILGNMAHQLVSAARGQADSHASAESDHES